MSVPRVLGRRDFLRLTGVAGAGLALGVRLGCAAKADAAFEPDAYLVVDGRGGVLVHVPRQELGQGVLTALPMLVAEELGADWERVRMDLAPAAPRFGSMTTGGSTSVRMHWEPLRAAGAAAREMLVAAAADRWRVNAAECRAERGEVLHDASGRRAPFGDLAAAAAKLPVPEAPPLKGRASWNLVGRSLPRADIPAKVDGSARFGFDFVLPELAYAFLVRPPTIGGKLVSFDASKALALPGVRQVFEERGGVAVVADSTWAALRGREALEIEWDPGPYAGFGDAEIDRELERAVANEAPVARDEGNVDRAFAAAAKVVEAEYRSAYLAHATMEPMNGTAWFDGDRCRVWIPTQNPRLARENVAHAVKLPIENVEVQPLYAGGGFGRRLRTDYAEEAASIAKRCSGPVKLLWTREDDTRNDAFRPASLHRLRAALDRSGRITAWTHRVAAPSITAQYRAVEGADHGMMRGSSDMPYRFPNIHVECALADLPVPVGAWRSVYDGNNAFANESFLDEIAHAAGRDPVELRLDLLPEGSKLRGVAARAAEAAGWAKGAPPGRAFGFACHECFGSAVAEVAEVSVRGGELRVHRVVCAVDPGVAVHPDGIVSQVEGGIAFGLGEALRGGVSFRNGRAVPGNFDDLQPLRFDEMPEIEVHIVEGGEPIGGIGEPPVPPIAPAVANALFAATGHRVRRLPIEASLRAFAG